MTTPTLTPDELTIALLEIRRQIAACGEHWGIRDTLRHKAMGIAARFVDPPWQAEQEEIAELA